jgi:hypothetical protein
LIAYRVIEPCFRRREFREAGTGGDQDGFHRQSSGQALAPLLQKEVSIMRKLMIVLAAIATIGVGATLPAFARGGGGHGGGGHGGMGHGGMGHGGMGRGGMGGGGFGRAAGIGHPGVARAAFARPGGIGRVGGVRPHGRHGNRFAFRHHRFHRRFAFIGAGFGYSAYDSCIAPVWTPWGWRWTNVCY